MGMERPSFYENIRFEIYVLQQIFLIIDGSRAAVKGFLRELEGKHTINIR